MLKTTLLATALVATAGAAQAAVPQFNATCPTNIEVHADKGGPIFINGKEASLKVFNANYYEAKHGHVTISLSINPDGTPSVSYTKDGGANGICTLVGGGSAKGGHKDNDYALTRFPDGSVEITLKGPPTCVTRFNIEGAMTYATEGRDGCQDKQIQRAQKIARESIKNL